MDIDVYIDFVYHGFYSLDAVEERFQEQYDAALDASGLLDDDEVLIYAVYTYDAASGRVISANFTSMVMKYDEFVDYYWSDEAYRRFFFMKGRTE